MFETLSMMPISFWVVVGILIAGGAWSFRWINDGSGIPMLAVLGTVTFWYVGDAFYNDYAGSYAKVFDSDVLRSAWWEVAWFLAVFLVAAPSVHRWFNARHLRNRSGVVQLAKSGVDYPVLQRQLDILFKGCLAIYAILALVAAIRVNGQILYFFLPFLGVNPEPWSRTRVGSSFSALLSFALYVQMMVTAAFGVLAAVSTNRRTRFLSLLLCFISWPCFIFDRTRNTILAVVIPAILCWVFLRLRGGILKKIAVLAAFFILLNGWMAFIIQNRTNESISIALRQKEFNLEQEESVHHQGLNMFEELCWINTFMKNGTCEPNWGRRYFAELVNPIPRSLWQGKPMIDVDYAIARGQGTRGDEGVQGDAGIDATISTGMIGQGVVNFGRISGPMAAALLMSFWVAVLARQDLHILQLGRLPLYACGMILTFNLGRDITFITLYPFVFGVVALWCLDWSRAGQGTRQEAKIEDRRGARLMVPQALNKRMQRFLIRRRRPVSQFWKRPIQWPMSRRRKFAMRSQAERCGSISRKGRKRPRSQRSEIRDQRSEVRKKKVTTKGTKQNINHG